MKRGTIGDMLTGDFSGQWWLPTDPDDIWGGFLHLADGEQPRLHVAGLMTDITRRMGAIVEHPVIHGITATGRLVSLFGGTETGGQSQLFTEAVGDTILTAPRAYVGNHFASEDSARFRRLAIKLTYLDSWFPAPLIQSEIELSKRGHLRRGVLTFEPGPGVQVKMPFGALDFGHDFSASGDLRSDAHFAQSASVVATTDRRQPLEWWLKTVVKPLRHLVSLSTERPVWVEQIHLRPWVTKPDDQVEVVWANDRSAEVRSNPHQAEMLFWYGDLAARFDQVLSDWFSVVAAIPDVLDQFMGTLNTSRSFAQTRFTMTASAAEAYHRERVGGTDATPAVHKERLRQARHGLDAQHLKWLNERLSSNAPTFYRRIVELCSLVPEVATLMVGEDIAAFARAVTDARNMRTHLDAHGKKALPPHSAIELQTKVAVLLEAVILQRELGFETADLAQRITRSSRLRRIAIRTARSS